MIYKNKITHKLTLITLSITLLYLLYIYLVDNLVKKIKVTNLKYTYEEIRNKLKDGDLLLLSCHDSIGNTIKFWSNDIFNHSGVVFWIDNHPYLLEADVNKDYDILTKKKKRGSHLISLDNKLSKYEGYYGCWYNIKKELKYDKYKKILIKYNNTKFEDNPLIWLFSRLKFDIYKYFNRSNNNRMFCSELIADFYKKCGVFKQKFPAHLYTFKDLRKEKCFKKGVYFRINSNINEI